MSLILTLGHAYAVAIGDIKKVAAFVETKALPVLQAAKADAPTVEAITALVCPQLANIERVGDAVLGVVIQAIEDAGTAAASGGLNVTLDAALVADIKAILPAIQSALKPVPPVVVTPAPAAA
jgi:hypothetical protein